MVLIGLMTTFVSSSYAQIGLEIGGHYWYAKSDMKGQNLESVEVRPGNLFGPHVEFHAGRFSVGTSMFFGSFEWQDDAADEEFETKRTDLNFRAGVDVFPKLNIFAAIKRLTLEGEKETGYFDAQSASGDRIIVGVENGGTLYGGGVAGRFPLARTPLFFSWSVSYLIGQMEWVFRGADIQESGNSANQIENQTQYDVSLTAFRIALGYQSRSGLTVMLGYRADLTGEEQGEERIHGIQATLAYAIR